MRPQVIDLRPRPVAPVMRVAAPAPAVPAPPALRRPLPWQAILFCGAAVASLTVGAIGGTALSHHQNSRHAITVKSVTGAQSATAQAAPAAIRMSQIQLQGLVSKLAAGIPATTSLSVIDLTSGVQAGSNADQPLVSASLYKLYVALAVYKGIDSGTITAGQTLSSGQTVNQCLDKMITVSDNDCGEALGSLVGWEKQNAMLAATGFTHTRLASATDEITSASDTALLFKRLAGGTLLSPNSSKQFMSLLKAQTINNRLPVGLPAGTVIAHKTGDLDSSVHDAGIVFAPSGAYVVSLMTTGWGSIGDAPAAFANVSQQLYTSLEQAKH